MKQDFINHQLVSACKERLFGQVHNCTPLPDVHFLSGELSAQQVQQTVNSWAGVDVSQAVTASWLTEGGAKSQLKHLTADRLSTCLTFPSTGPLGQETCQCPHVSFWFHLFPLILYLLLKGLNSNAHSGWADNRNVYSGPREVEYMLPLHRQLLRSSAESAQGERRPCAAITSNFQKASNI